nr:MAG TPA_asm: hypothetical protein [Caudoviricetes sp.]
MQRNFICEIRNKFTIVFYSSSGTTETKIHNINHL